ncbi:hypothetical protein [Burkholderia metallica]|nr:hypothetical protein [Burkholderia metallica]
MISPSEQPYENNAISRCSKGILAVTQSILDGGIAMKRKGDDFDWS